MNRLAFRELAEVRIVEARALFDQGLPDGAYYLAGYAVECALKACICRLTVPDDFPARDTSRTHYVHSIEKLVLTAGLVSQRAKDIDADHDLADNWSTVKDWDEESRYSRRTHEQARDLIEAITNVDHGVLSWIRSHW